MSRCNQDRAAEASPQGPGRPLVPAAPSSKRGPPLEQGAHPRRRRARAPSAPLGHHRLLWGALWLASACQYPDADDPRPPNVQTSTAAQTTLASRAGKVRQFPCSQCHEQVDAAALRQPGREPHHDIDMKHAPVPCLTCHNDRDLDTLHTLTGEPVSFDEVHKVCGQCHAERVKDWKIGAHGKTIGGWAKPRQRYTCTECHNPHQPAFPSMKAKPAPPFPRLGIPKGDPSHD